MGLFLMALVPCVLDSAMPSADGHNSSVASRTKLSGRAAPVLTEFTARLRCRSKSGASIDDSWCRDNYLQSPSADMCLCDEAPSQQELDCAKVEGWEHPRSYLMAGCSASTFIGRATVEVLKEAGLCPFDFLDTRFRYTTSNNGILLPELLEGTKESHQTAVLNTVPEDLNYIAQAYPKLLNGTRMVHIFRENYLDEIKCRTAGGWAVGQHSKKKFRLTPARMLKEMRDALDNQASTTQQMARMGFGNVALTTEALTQFEFDDSDAGWQRSLDAWQVLTRAWGVKVPLNDIRRALKRVGTPQKPHARHADTFANADAIRDALMKAGPPFSSWCVSRIAVHCTRPGAVCCAIAHQLSPPPHPPTHAPLAGFGPTPPKPHQFPRLSEHLGHHCTRLATRVQQTKKWRRPGRDARRSKFPKKLKRRATTTEGAIVFPSWSTSPMRGALTHACAVIARRASANAKAPHRSHRGRRSSLPESHQAWMATRVSLSLWSTGTNQMRHVGGGGR